MLRDVFDLLNPSQCWVNSLLTMPSLIGNWVPGKHKAINLSTPEAMEDRGAFSFSGTMVHATTFGQMKP
jgi:hypothetical protein